MYVFIATLTCCIFIGDEFRLLVRQRGGERYSKILRDHRHLFSNVRVCIVYDAAIVVPHRLWFLVLY